MPGRSTCRRAALPTGKKLCAYNAGEPEAQKALKIFARRVAVGILSLQHVLDVEKVAIGGGISAAEALLPAIQAELDWLFERCTVMQGGQAGAGALPAMATMQPDRCPEAVL